MSDLLGPVLKSASFQFASLVVGVLFLLLACAIVIWLYKDAVSRGMRATTWAGIVAGLGALGGLAGFSQAKFGFAPTGVFAFFTIIILVFVYMILRPSEFKDDVEEQELSIALLEAELDIKSCPHCHYGIESDFLVCPQCMKILREPCRACKRPIKREWKVCPYCKTKQEKQENKN